MRTVYAIQPSVVLRAGQTPVGCYDDIISRVCRWVEVRYERNKFNQPGPIVVSVPRDGAIMTPIDGHAIRGQIQAADESQLFTLEWTHPHYPDTSTQWATTVVVARVGNAIQMAVSCAGWGD